MSHDTHDTHGHHHDTHNDKPVVEFKAAFYFVLILAGLFVAGIGFVKSMSGSHETHTEAAGHNEHGAATHEATSEDHSHGATDTHKETAPAGHH